MAKKSKERLIEFNNDIDLKVDHFDRLDTLHKHKRPIYVKLWQWAMRGENTRTKVFRFSIILSAKILLIYTGYEISPDVIDFIFLFF